MNEANKKYFIKGSTLKISNDSGDTLIKKSSIHVTAIFKPSLYRSYMTGCEIYNEFDDERPKTTIKTYFEVFGSFDVSDKFNIVIPDNSNTLEWAPCKHYDHIAHRFSSNKISKIHVHYYHKFSSECLDHPLEIYDVVVHVILSEIMYNDIVSLLSNGSIDQLELKYEIPAFVHHKNGEAVVFMLLDEMTPQFHLSTFALPNRSDIYENISLLREDILTIKKVLNCT